MTTGLAPNASVWQAQTRRGKHAHKLNDYSHYCRSAKSALGLVFWQTVPFPIHDQPWWYLDGSGEPKRLLPKLATIKICPCASGLTIWFGLIVRHLRCLLWHRFTLVDLNFIGFMVWKLLIWISVSLCEQTHMLVLNSVTRFSSQI